MAELNLGDDGILAPDGIHATGEMLDESLGAQATTDFIVRITNNSNTPVPNFRVFVDRIAPTDPNVNLFPAHVHVVQLDPGETEECHFLVQNHTPGAVQTTFRFRVRSSYFGISDPAIGGATHEYNNFVRP